MVKSSIQEMKLNRRGIMVVLSSPSGAGKTTLTKQILNTSKNILMSVSATTRQPRPGEVDGEDYIFLSKSKFSEMIDNDEFLEYAKVFDNFYGTPRAPVEDALAGGFDIVFDIDWQGAQQLTQAAANDLVKIFILPPNVQELENRLRSRAQDSEDVIARRMSKSENEISHWAEYDYIIINKNLETCFKQIESIILTNKSDVIGSLQKVQ